MTNAITIFKKDFKSYFTSPIAYILMAVFSFIMGFMFFSILNVYVLQGMQFEQFKMGKAPSLSESFLRPFFGNMNVVLLFLIPFITMRLFAEERKNNTIELLLTAPVKLQEIVLGKFLSAVAFIGVLLLLTVPLMMTLHMAVKPDWSVVITSYLGTFLMVGTYVSVGILFSSLTENQIIAGAASFGMILFMWIIKWASYNAGPVWSDLLGYLSIIDHFEDFSKGVLSTKDIIFYFSSIGLWLFLTYKALESYSWRS